MTMKSYSTNNIHNIGFQLELLTNKIQFLWEQDYDVSQLVEEHLKLTKIYIKLVEEKITCQH